MRSGFFIDKGRPVYAHWNEAVGQTKYELPGAEAATFKNIERAGGARAEYACDAYSVYMARDHRATKIAGANAKTFALMTRDGAFARDRERVYYFGIPIEGADPKTFHQISGAFESDTNRAYLGAIPISVADIASWEPLQAGHYDDLSIQLDRERDPQAEIAPISARGWSRDAMNVYFGSKPFPEADRATFEVLSDWYAKDRANVYYFNQRIPGADAPSFTVTDGPFLPGTRTHSGPGPHARDMNHSYQSGKPQ
jgi:hypothetical protein